MIHTYNEVNLKVTEVFGRGTRSQSRITTTEAKPLAGDRKRGHWQLRVAFSLPYLETFHE